MFQRRYDLCTIAAVPLSSSFHFVDALNDFNSNRISHKKLIKQISYCHSLLTVINNEILSLNNSFLPQYNDAKIFRREIKKLESGCTFIIFNFFFCHYKSLLAISESHKEMLNHNATHCFVEFRLSRIRCFKIVSFRISLPFTKNLSV